MSAGAGLFLAHFRPTLYNGKENGDYYSILGLYRDNGKENENYYGILGLYRDNGKENGNYHSISL